MYSGKKAILFTGFGLALGYFCHRLVLLYDSLPNQPPLERLAYLLGDGQNQVLNPLWNFAFTGKSLLVFVFGVISMGLVYLYVSTGQKVYREGQEYGSARFGTSKEGQAFRSQNSINDTIMSRRFRLTLLEKKKPPFDRNKNLVVLEQGRPFALSNPILFNLIAPIL
ncbi:hypothetical protein STRIC_1183 [Streptococcus ictaluri 707-05]|uniref:Type IV secretory system conjugative DNA transfer family protein n=1 Tax=Streptococcus ictaluri 707-05 TaxID=764299 RepID=G5K315_9STRE|nr:hypothetical protein STRIC_1183 [Streptococcus ictaluri 707-05]